MTATIDLPAITAPECTGCIRETEKSSKHRAFQPRKGGCSAHQDAPAHAAAARILAQLGPAARITITHGEVTVEYVATGDDADTIEQQWARAAEACGVSLGWQRLLISPRDTQVKARVRHGYVDPGMPCEYRRGVPVRLVAHGWTAAADRLAA
ncbi:hypothetical protein KCMC57_64780 (plasmid) [Kitasatospora sp. CMC57]|uniref:HMA domain-containing protein n=1 Tax=Kitasatospora sp. CMC57 TaxID=3231513 RepID=A0AB33KF86_9ACTN